MTNPPASKKDQRLPEQGFKPGVVERFQTIAEKLLIHFNVGPLEKSVAKGFLQIFAKNADDQQIFDSVQMIQREILPYILYGSGDPEHEDQN